MSSESKRGPGTSGTEPATKTGSTTAGAIKNTAEQLLQQAKEAGAEAGSYLGNRAETMADSLSGGLKATARTIRDNAPKDGLLGGATSAVAQRLSNSANYLDEHGLKDLTGDLSSLIGKNPIPAFLVGIGLGMLLGQVSPRSKS